MQHERVSRGQRRRGTNGGTINGDCEAPAGRPAAVWASSRSGGAWSQQGPKLTGGGEAGEGEFGTNVALSADGNTALIGGWRDNGGTGATTQSVGASSSPSPLAASIGGLAPGTTYHFRLVAENSGGVAYGGDQTFTIEARGETPTTEVITTPPPAQPTSPSPSVPSETTLPPAVQLARQSTTRWREGNRLARISRAKTPTGTTFSFLLNEQAT